MTNLLLEPNTEDPDDVYDRLIALHEGLDDETSHRVNARLILLLINQVGDAGRVLRAITLARDPRGSGAGHWGRPWQ